MLRLRSCILPRLLSYPTAHHGCSLHRLLSAAVSPSAGFQVEHYLVSTCGLTRAQALKASAKLSHLKCPAKPDAVLAFLAGLGLSAADVAALVAKDPQLLCASVDSTLGPAAVGLIRLGLSRSEVARLVSICPDRFRRKYVVSKVQYYLPLFGSSKELLSGLKTGLLLLSVDLDRVVKPNVAVLQECGLGARDIAKLLVQMPMVITAGPERVHAMVACAERIGVPRGSGMFRWPIVLRWSKDILHRKFEFLTATVGLEQAYVAHRPTMLGLSLEGRLKPRYYVMRFLKENGLLSHGRDYYSMVLISEKVFTERFISPHKQAAPHIAQDYATACTGELPARFRFT